MEVSETDITHKNRWMVLSRLIQSCNHELRYSFSLHIVLSHKHATTWLDSVNTSPVHFTTLEDSQHYIWTELFFLDCVWVWDPVAVFTYHNLWTTGEDYFSHLSVATGNHAASSCRCPGTCRSLPAPSFSVCAPLSNCCRWNTDGTALETIPALSLCLKFTKKVTNPFNRKTEIL